MGGGNAKPRKEPEQERARFTFDAILEAAARILRNEGPGQLTTNRIAEVAGVSVGSLYQYFPNKDAIVGRLIELELERDVAHAAEMFGAFDAMSLRDAFVVLRAQMIERARHAQALHEHLLPRVSELERDRFVRERVAQTLHGFVEFLSSRPDELREPYASDRAALEAASLLVFGAIETMINLSKVSRPDLLEGPILPDLVDQLGMLLLRHD